MIDHTTVESTSFTQDRSLNLGVVDLAGRQVAGTRVDRRLLIIKAEGGLLIGQGKVRVIESLNRADVFPVAIK